jgi:ribonucleoside-diphosphate reductase beta chain
MSLTKMSQIYQDRVALYPMPYPWADLAYEEHERCHWVFDIVPLTSDVSDFFRADTKTKQLITDILFLFTQSDVDIGKAYYERYIPLFKHTELRAMMGSFAAREATHFKAYSLLNKTLGLPDSSFTEFVNIKPMFDKHDYLEQIFNTELSMNPLQHYKEIAIFSGFVEGFSLFSSFAILASFAKTGVGKFFGTKNIVQYSAQEESMHFKYMLLLAKTIKEENNDLDWDSIDKLLVEEIIPEIWKREIAFVKYLFRDIEDGSDYHIDGNKVINFLGSIVTDRCKDLCIPLPACVKYDPSDREVRTTFDNMIQLPEFANFFETRATGYIRGGVKGSLSDDTIAWPM